jgi:hypothetical protein
MKDQISLAFFWNKIVKGPLLCVIICRLILYITNHYIRPLIGRYYPYECNMLRLRGSRSDVFVCTLCSVIGAISINLKYFLGYYHFLTILFAFDPRCLVCFLFCEKFFIW